MSKDYLIFAVTTLKHNFMYKIEYDISLNEERRPFIFLPENYEQNPEDRFFAIEITRYILGDLLARRTTDLDSNTVQYLDEAERLLGQLGDETAKILYEGMRAQGEMYLMLDNAYHITVSSIEERDNLPDKDIVYEDKIFDRVEGLRVYVQYPIEEWDVEKAGLYELVNGITNEHWKKHGK